MTTIIFISLIQLIQHPAEYHDKHVRVIGFARMAFEAKAIYVSKDDRDHAITKNAIWLDKDISQETRKYDQKYVLVEGVFDKNNLGHLKLYSGAIKNISRLEVWSEGTKPAD